MTEKELKKLNRYQLLELLVAQTERAEKLEAQMEELRNSDHDKDLQIAVLGSIADASLQLNGVFQAAQAAADMYLEAAKLRAEEMEREARDRAALIIRQAEIQAKKILG